MKIEKVFTPPPPPPPPRKKKLSPLHLPTIFSHQTFVKEYARAPSRKRVSVASPTNIPKRTKKPRSPQLKRKLSELQKCANCLEENQVLLKEELRKKTFSAAIIGERNDDFHFYTGLADYATFQTLLSSFEDKLPSLYLAHSEASNPGVQEEVMKNKIGRPRALSNADDFFLTPVKLRLDFPVDDLRVCFLGCPRRPKFLRF